MNRSEDATAIQHPTRVLPHNEEASPPLSGSRLAVLSVSPAATRWAAVDRVIRILCSLAVGVSALFWRISSSSSSDSSFSPLQNPLWSKGFTESSRTLDFNCHTVETCWQPQDAIIQFVSLGFAFFSLVATILQWPPSSCSTTTTTKSSSAHLIPRRRAICASVALGVAEHLWHILFGFLFIRLVQGGSGWTIWSMVVTTTTIFEGGEAYPTFSMLPWAVLVESIWAPHRSALGLHLYIPTCMFAIAIAYATAITWNLLRQTNAGNAPSGGDIASNIFLGVIASTALAYLVDRVFSLIRDFSAIFFRNRIAIARGRVCKSAGIPYRGEESTSNRHTLDVWQPGPNSAANKEKRINLESSPLLTTTTQNPATATTGSPLLKPVIIFWHGGAYKFGSRSQASNKGATWAEYGDVICVLPNYRLGPRNAWPTMGEDAGAAVKWVVENIATFGGDPNCLFFAGHSAGGHLCMNTTVHSHRLQGILKKKESLRGMICISSGRARIGGTSRLFPTEEARRDGCLATFTDEMTMRRRGASQKKNGDGEGSSNVSNGTSSSFSAQNTPDDGGGGGGGDGDWDCPPALFLLSHLEALAFHTRTKEAYENYQNATITPTSNSSSSSSTRLEYFPLHSHISEALAVGSPEDMLTHLVLDFVHSHK